LIERPVKIVAPTRREKRKPGEAVIT
jgi:hypothetical protein